MTRQWLSAPNMMCMPHLTGEHAETHMFLNKMQRGFALKGFIDNSMFFGASFVEYRHNLISNLLPGHKTPLVITDDIKEAYPYIDVTSYDVRKSLNDLISRCSECNRKWADSLRNSLELIVG